MSKGYVNPCKVITGTSTRWSYANVWEPKSINGSTPKYSVSLIIPKSDVQTVKKIQAAIKAAYEEGQGKLKGNSRSVPSLDAIKTPLRDGDLERPGDDAYKELLLHQTPIPPQSPVLSMRTASKSWNAPKSTAGYMAGLPSTSTPSTRTEIRALPAASTISRKSVMANLSAGECALRMNFPL